MGGERKGGILRVEDLPGGIPLYIEGGTVFRLRQSVLELEEADARVTCGAGVGGDFVTLQWGKRQATFYLRDVLKAWVGTFAPAEAERIPGTDFEPNFTEGASNE